MSKRFATILAENQLEPDQRLRDALQLASPQSSTGGTVWTSHLLEALCRLNTRGSSAIPLETFETFESARRVHPEYVIPTGTPQWWDEVTTAQLDIGVMRAAVESAKGGSTFGASHFLQALADEAIRAPSFTSRSRGTDFLAYLLGGSATADLRRSQRLTQLVQSLRNSPDGVDDYQYVFTLEGGRIHFRVASTIADYTQESDCGLWVPQRALLTHLGRIGAFTVDEVEELEELLNPVVGARPRSGVG